MNFIHRQAFKASLAAVFLASVGMRILIPPVINLGAIHDDELLVRLAHEIQNGHWLGDYTNLGHLTLAKPAGYPLFLAATSWLPWPQTVTQHVLLLSAILVLTREARIWGASRRVTLTLFSALALFPVWFGDQMSRIYREGLLVPLTWWHLTLVLFSVRLVLVQSSNRQSKLLVLKLLVTLLLNGLVLGYSTITKNFWYGNIIFSTILLGGISYRFIRSSVKLSHRLLPGLLLITFLFGAILPSTLVKRMNESRYGVSIVDSYTQGSFPKVMNDLSSIEPSGTRGFVTVTEVQRKQAYAISPTFAELEPYLERTWGVGWRGSACGTIGICDESGAWFPWELRDAVELAGIGDDSAEDFENAFSRIHAEIQAACQLKKIDCGLRPLSPGLASLNNLSLKNFLDSLAHAFQWMIERPLASGVRAVDTQHPTFEIWRGVVPGLEGWSLSEYSPEQCPNSQCPTRFQADNYGLGNVQRLSGDVFEALWVPLIVAAVFCIAIPNRQRIADKSRFLRVVATSAAFSVIIPSMLLAALEASSGAFVSIGGGLYTLPLFPSACIFVIAGIGRGAVLMKDRIEGLYMQGS